MTPGRVLVTYNRVSEGADPSTRDVLDQVELVLGGLDGCGLAGDAMALSGPADAARISHRPGLVIFNLVESPPGRPRLQVEVAAAFERSSLPFTGSGSEVLWSTTDKVATRALLAGAGLPVAPGAVLDPAHPVALDQVPPPWIVKPAWEDASLGLEGRSVVDEPAAALARAAGLAARFPGQPLLVEHFLPGREFNLSLLDMDGVITVLPVAEMLYLDDEPDAERVLGYEAKWDRGSRAYTRTVRAFLDPTADARLVGDLRRLALAAWHACGLEGYARIDLRCDEDGTPCILEANANPCLSADAGYMAAAAQLGLHPTDVVRLILAAALAGAP